MIRRSTTARLFAACLLAPLAAAAHAIDLGDASVVSQQGQRLKVAVPFGSAPGEKVPVTRFSVAAVEVPVGHRIVSAEQFVISKPENRNVVFLQSREPVDASKVTLIVKVAQSDTAQVAYDLTVPPAKYAAFDEPAAPAPKLKPVKRKPRAKRTAG